ncbi:tetratricopeptide repeat protein [Actinomadura hibisca]|uniref:tetratricopeptide repeat protein n=1 Tax=Actinomadura hibisca TaxID=68565 RepID=UPI00082CD5BB|nr:tetratricopeptide repeat protein [Actinomadura hibisca]
MNSCSVFISYAPTDAAWVRALTPPLLEAGVAIAYDALVLGPGAVAVHRLEDAIRDSAAGLLITSRAALSEAWVREEYAALMRRSIEGGRRFVPVLIEDVELPEFAANRYCCDLRNADGEEFARRVSELARVLRGDGPELPQPGPPVRPGTGVRPEGPQRFVLRVSEAAVELRREDTGALLAEHVPAGFTHRLDDLRRHLENARGSDVHLTKGDAAGPDALLDAFGRSLGSAFLDGPAGAALAGQLAEAERLNATLRLGLECAEPLADLPWEALVLPGQAEPLALHPRVRLYRRQAAGQTPAMAIPGPLRILVAVAGPESPGDDMTLDLEAELQKILGAVESARHPVDPRRKAHVRILNEGTLESIRDALLQERFHVLHISCHAEPGALLLEDEQGGVDRVTTERFVRDLLPPDRGVPLVVLSGCSTARAEGPELGGLARGLAQAGVPAVLAMTAPVTDVYATALAEMLYRELAIRDAPEALPAFCDARRRLEEARRRLPEEDPYAALVEWATPALFLRGPSLRLYDPAAPFEEIAPVVEQQYAEGVPLRQVGEFVGRRGEIRRLRRALRGSARGVLLHGIGGLGKSSLAVELLRRLGADAGLVVSAVGQTTTEQILTSMAERLAATFRDEVVQSAAQLLWDAKQPWQARLRGIAPLLARLPVTLLLDNFEDNLDLHGSEPVPHDADLAEFLATWLRLPGRHRLLVTSRYTFPLPRRSERLLVADHLGPLSWAETRKLMWRLAALERLAPADQRRAWADVGGHPRTLEYLDALLRSGTAQFHDVQEQLEDLLERRGIADPDAWFREAGRDFDGALAESITLTVDDVLLGELLDRLSDLERDVLVGMSVYRTPAPALAGAWWIAEPAAFLSDSGRNARLERLNRLFEEAGPDAGLADLGLPEEEQEQAARDVASLSMPPVEPPPGLEEAMRTLVRLGLLSRTPTPETPMYTMHRWTAGTLTGLAGPEAIVKAHRAAAVRLGWMWQHWRPEALVEIGVLLEVRHHAEAAGDRKLAISFAYTALNRLQERGVWGWQRQLLAELLGQVEPDSLEYASILMRLGDIALNLGDYDQALEHYKSALEIREREGDEAGVASCYNQLGGVATECGAFQQAQEWLERALEISERLGDRRNLANAHLELSNLLLQQLRMAEAARHCEESLRLFELLDDRQEVGGVGYQLAMIVQELGEVDRSQELLERSLEIARETDQQIMISRIQHEMGNLARLRGDPGTAVELYHQSLALKERTGNRTGMAVSYVALGSIAREQGDIEHALSWFSRALELNHQLGRTAMVATCLLDMGGMHAELGDLPEAIRYAAASLPLLLQVESPAVPQAVLRLARCRELMGDEAAFRSVLAECMSDELTELLYEAFEANAATPEGGSG